MLLIVGSMALQIFVPLNARRFLAKDLLTRGRK